MKRIQSQTDAGLLIENLKPTPFWTEDSESIDNLEKRPPDSADAIVIGSGYTGLNAALQIARGGRNVVVLEAGTPGAGCSTRNGGQIHNNIKPSTNRGLRSLGAERERAVLDEGRLAVDWLEAFLAEEKIDCEFGRFGSYHAAHTPWHYERMAREADDTHVVMIPREQQRREIGSDHYFGGAVHPRDGSLHPAKYHHGLLNRCLASGVSIVPHCAVTGIRSEATEITVATEMGTVRARNVAVATNGYTTSAMPWLRRRVIPIGSYIIATEPLEQALIDQLMPTNRAITDTRKVVYYYRPSPDRRRIVFGGRVSATETDPLVSAPKLHAEMCRIFPELRGIGISHSWHGTVAFSFDELPHTGRHNGVHYAMGYCGSGVAMASYLGARMGQKILGLAEGRTALDDLPFPKQLFYRGHPWFLPALVSWYRWRDNLERSQAAKVL